MPSVGNRAAGLTTSKEHVWGFWGTGRQGHTYSGDCRVLYVNPNHPNASDGFTGASNTGEDPEAPFATIAAALLRCRDCYGDTICVMDNDGWKYGGGGGATMQTPIQEEVTIDVEGVRLIGVSSGYGVTWEPITAAGAGTCITIAALNVLVEGFAFQGAAAGGRGIYAIWDGTTLFGENYVIKNCSFDEHIDIGIQVDNTWNAEIAGCIFQNCDAYGIYLDPAVQDASDMYIHDCRFLDCGTGAISMEGLNNSVIKDCTIYNGDAQAAALATDEGIDLTAGSDNIVCDCYFSCVLPAGANGDWDDLNTGTATDAWISCHTMNGMAVTTPT